MSTILPSTIYHLIVLPSYHLPSYHLPSYRLTFLPSYHFTIYHLPSYHLFHKIEMTDLVELAPLFLERAFAIRVNVEDLATWTF